MSCTANSSETQTHFKHLFTVINILQLNLFIACFFYKEISKWHQATGLQGIEKLKNRCDFSKVIRKLIQTHNVDVQQLPDDSVVNSFLMIAATRFPELKKWLGDIDANGKFLLLVYTFSKTIF